MTSIGLIVNCFFREWPYPSWFDLFVESCRQNPTVQFYFLTDSPGVRLYGGANVEVVHMALRELQDLVSARLGLDVTIKIPFKLIDFTTAYGVIFEDLLGEYDFFGHCDMDVIFGDIRSFLTEETLARYDVISARREFPTGHFMLFRRELARIYERSRDHQKVFSGTRVFNFDECGWGLHYKLLNGASFADVAEEAEIESLMHVLDRSPDLRVHYKTICDEYLPKVLGSHSASRRLIWERESGKLHDVESGRELMYYHLQALKRDPRFYVPRWERIPPAILISRKGVTRVGEQDLRQRLANTVARWRYFFTKSGSNLQSYYRMWRRRLSSRTAPPSDSTTPASDNRASISTANRETFGR